MTRQHDNYLLPPNDVQISFSGGRTSAFMLHQILEANGSLPDRVKISFANTGREMPETLDFVQECAQRWDVPIIWVEYKRYKEERKNSYRIVSHNEASRDGEPFKELIEAKKYLPNAVARFCTAELKIRPMKKYLLSIGWKNWTACLGIRADEAHRAKPDSKDRWVFWHPLVDAGITKRDIYQFWKSQPFDLQLENVNGSTPLGNCDMCFLKSEKILANIAKTMPDKADWWVRMERETGSTFRKDRDLAEFTDFVGRQSDWVFDDESFFCQADDGECTG
jgi:3'-phosphoadenosine 5'-phosphosulfate sulfotransferase (PAPS reductase)/FAD synthetase